MQCVPRSSLWCCTERMDPHPKELWTGSTCEAGSPDTCTSPVPEGSSQRGANLNWSDWKVFPLHSFLFFLISYLSASVRRYHPFTVFLCFFCSWSCISVYLRNRQTDTLTFPAWLVFSQATLLLLSSEEEGPGNVIAPEQHQRFWAHNHVCWVCQSFFFYLLNFSVFPYLFSYPSNQGMFSSGCNASALRSWHPSRPHWRNFNWFPDWRSLC